MAEAQRWTGGSGGLCRFQVVYERRGGFRWLLVNPSGTPVAASADVYPSEDAPVEAAGDARDEIARAPIVPA
ncbi:MAG: hypothetical protein M3301_08225 [Chloroflexota bacterium]|nr:hypothetical protein [Chloroflexota bacterium]